MTSSSLRAGLSGCLLVSAAALLGACSGAGGADRYDDATPGPTQSVSQYTPPASTNPNTVVTPATPGSGTAMEGNPTPGQVAMGGMQATAMGGVDSAPLGAANMGGAGTSMDRYQKADVTRDGKNYYFMANGWGPGFVSQTVSWKGTSFTVQSMNGTEGPNYQPASYPTMFCGAYSDARSKECGLPAALDSMTALETGWKWNPNGNTGEYNAAYDIWMGTSADRSSFSGYLMVWYREPVGQQPAGQPMLRGVTVQNVSGTWDIWTGRVGNRPIINWVRAENQDTLEMEFDILDFVRDAQTRGLQVPGTHVLSVAIGFEMWSPVTNLESTDFYVDVVK
jgi:hypothetical protein